MASPTMQQIREMSMPLLAEYEQCTHCGHKGKYHAKNGSGTGAELRDANLKGCQAHKTRTDPTVCNCQRRQQ